MIIRIKGNNEMVSTKLIEVMLQAGYACLNESYAAGFTSYVFTDDDFDFENRTVNGKRLRGILFYVAKYFIDNPRIISKDELEDEFWSESNVTLASEGGKVVEVTISKLRKFMDIENIRGVGWRLK